MKHLYLTLALALLGLTLFAWEEPTYKLAYQNSIYHGAAFGCRINSKIPQLRELYIMASCLISPNYKKEKTAIASLYSEHNFIYSNNFYTKLLAGVQVAQVKFDDDPVRKFIFPKIAAGIGNQWEIDDGIFVYFDGDIGLQLILCTVNLGIKF